MSIPTSDTTYLRTINLLARSNHMQVLGHLPHQKAAAGGGPTWHEGTKRAHTKAWRVTT